MQAPMEEYAMWGKRETSVKAVNAEYETEIHFQKCYGVMAEVFEVHNNLDAFLPRNGFRFLDLGCAPGGFSSYLLEDPRCQLGFGVTLPSSSGGFPVRVRSSNFFLQQADLFEIGPTDLVSSEVHVCVCDAQYLRNNISWDEKYRGVRCRSKQHGVWALLLKQFWLGLSRLLAGGMLIFRFGWRDPGPEDPATIWYKKMTLRLFTLLIDLFGQVREVKSDYFNALQSSFYVCCTNFKRERFVEREVLKLLGVTFNYLLSTDIRDSNELDILPQADRLRTEEVDKRISDMLDRIQKIRLVHEQSRKWHHKQEVTREDPRAAVVLTPVPPTLTNEEVAAMLSVYGHVLRVDRDEHQVSIQFTMLDQARSAVSTLRSSKAFGEGVRIWLREEEMASPTSDSWSGASPTTDTWSGDWSAVGAGKSAWTYDDRSTWSTKGDQYAEAAAREAPVNRPTPQVAKPAQVKAAASPPGFAPQPRSSQQAPAAPAAGGTLSRQEAATQPTAPQPAKRRSAVAEADEAPARGAAAAKGPPAVQGAAAPATSPTPAAPLPTAAPGAKAGTAKQAAKACGGPSPPAGSPLAKSPVAAGDGKAVHDKALGKPSLHPVLQDKQARTRELIAELLKSK